MRFASRLLAAATLALLQACATAPVQAPAPVDRIAEEARPSVTILISIDGFRADYLDRGVTPNLNDLAAHGISAAMRPSFPSKTFPNHWTLVTGLRPDRSGIVSNNMEAPGRTEPKFTMEIDKDPWWWGTAEPLWVTAEKAGIRSATMFWPGSNVAWGGTMKADKEVSGGIRPSDWWPFDEVVTSDQRVSGVLDWLRRPAATRPRFITLYFDIVDTAGHNHGPDAPETTAAVHEADTAIGELRMGLGALGQPANLVIVADHGMASTSQKRTIAMDKIANSADYRLFESGVFASLFPVPGHEAALEAALLRPHDHLQCWRKAEIPARLHYGGNPRIPPYFCLADVGWTTVKTDPAEQKDLGGHGYDNMAPEMTALFIASGPAIRPAGRLPGFDNVDVAPLVRDLLGLPPGKELDGDDAPFRAALTR